MKKVIFFIIAQAYSVTAIAESPVQNSLLENLDRVVGHQEQILEEQWRNEAHFIKAFRNAAEICSDPLEYTSFYDSTTEARRVLKRNKVSELCQYRQTAQMDVLTGVILPNMKKIPEGEFMMGCWNDDTYCDDDERPQHPEKVKTFFLAETETAYDQWKQCALEQACSKTPIEQDAVYDDPVVNVSYPDVLQYISWLNQKTGKQFRLPTEAEWEYAARAGKESVFISSLKELCRYENFADENLKDKTTEAGWHEPHCEDRSDESTEVASHLPNAFGLFDMGGNVSEWTQECWRSSYETEVPEIDQVEVVEKEQKCVKRAVRGGNWLSTPKQLRFSYRAAAEDVRKDHLLGFRLVLMQADDLAEHK